MQKFGINKITTAMLVSAWYNINIACVRPWVQTPGTEPKVV